MKHNDNACNEKDLGLSEKSRISETPEQLGMTTKGPNQKPMGGGKPEKSKGPKYR